MALKTFVKGVLFLLLGIVIGGLAMMSYFSKQVNSKIVTINESRLMADVALLEALQKEDQKKAVEQLNVGIDRALSTMYLWSQLKQTPSQPVREVITRLQRVREEAPIPYQPATDLAPTVEKALQLGAPSSASP